MTTTSDANGYNSNEKELNNNTSRVPISKADLVPLSFMFKVHDIYFE
jgi:hypothetical protein